MESKPLYSCIICRQVKQSRSLAFHFMAMHTDAETKKRLVGGKHRVHQKQNLENSPQAIKTKEDRLQYSISPKKCKKCEIELPYHQRKNTFCSHTCSATFEDRQRGRKIPESQKKNISAGIKTFVAKKNAERRKTGNVKFTSDEFNDAIAGPFTKIYLCTCKISGVKWYSTTVKQIHPDAAKSYQDYGYHARFSFGISSYPEWFKDASSLIAEHGWYSTPGSKKSGTKNTNGISRDHMLSVSDGYKQGINPLLLAHPANCQLMPHTDNQKKLTRSTISKEDLLKRIQDFNKMYPESSFVSM